MQLTIASYLQGLKNKDFSPKEVLLDYQKRAKALNTEFNACVRFNDEYVNAHFEEFSTRALRIISSLKGSRSLVVLKCLKVILLLIQRAVYRI